MKTSYILVILLLIFLVACGSAKSTTLAPLASALPTEPGLTLLPSWTDTPTFTPTITQTQTITPTCTTAPFLIYTAQIGETCSIISVKSKITIAQLLDANPILKGDCINLQHGMDLVIPLSEWPTLTASVIVPTSKPYESRTPLYQLPTTIPTKLLLPTWTSGPQPTLVPQPTTKSCCKVCTNSKACGNSCISNNKNCNTPPGCACQG